MQLSKDAKSSVLGISLSWDRYSVASLCVDPCCPQHLNIIPLRKVYSNILLMLLESANITISGSDFVFSNPGICSVGSISNSQVGQQQLPIPNGSQISYML